VTIYHGRCEDVLPSASRHWLLAVMDSGFRRNDGLIRRGSQD
jgi:hypothetical protein